MLDILTRAGCFVAIILLGYTFRRTGIFGSETFGVLSKVVMKITLPAALIASAAGKPIDASMMTIALLGLGGGLIYIFLGWLIALKEGRSEQAFYIQNIPGYNIGTFALPFTQSFLGPVGVLTTSIFDLGNALICFGASYSVARAVKDGGKPDFRRIAKTAVSSIPFLTHVLMVILNLNSLTPPKPILTLAEILGGGNACLAMLMIGVSMNISVDRQKIGAMVKVLVTRFGIAAILALAWFYLLPFSLEIRQTLVILAFSPIGSTVPIFTAELGEDVGLSSTINSIAIVISIVIIVTLLTVML